MIREFPIVPFRTLMQEDCRVCHVRGAVSVAFRLFERKSVLGEVPLHPWGFAVLYTCDEPHCMKVALSRLGPRQHVW